MERRRARDSAQDFEMVRARTLCEDVLSSNSAPSSATPRGHVPAAFLIRASGLGSDGLGARGEGRDLDRCYRFTHIDIGGAA